jgi:hypothetical protein
MKFGAPERIRTSDLRFRKPPLYPTELRGRTGRHHLPPTPLAPTRTPIDLLHRPTDPQIPKSAAPNRQSRTSLKPRRSNPNYPDIPPIPPGLSNESERILAELPQLAIPTLRSSISNDFLLIQTSQTQPDSKTPSQAVLPFSRHTICLNLTIYRKQPSQVSKTVNSCYFHDLDFILSTNTRLMRRPRPTLPLTFTGNFSHIHLYVLNEMTGG